MNASHASSVYVYIVRWLLIGVWSVLLTGCQSIGNNTATPSEPPPSLSELAHQAAEEMVSHHPDILSSSPMIAATFVDIDNLDSSSTLGRITSEIMASALVRQGMQLREVKIRDNLFMEESMGEHILPRQLNRASARLDARSILMGTYAQGEDYLYVSARLVRLTDALVLGSADFQIRLDNNIRSLLDDGGW